MTEQLIFVAVLVVTVLSGAAAMVLALRSQQAPSPIQTVVAQRLIEVTLIGAAALAALLGRG
ncbi:hypothetical protein NGM99_20800 [Mesorhizobium sp. RP14(2022)]|uniref:HIG1 domain-containing protein n=1 Tax=Mesorhizobium liriopis TaxID=2953882 RepID=A0ABT1CDG6_9HYPH|nr:hypothetical protein [Mesorhizobium liriopis]MCO6052231.1 hypothetical protein [Mesorhizobium liriopis]